MIIHDDLIIPTKRSLSSSESRTVVFFYFEILGFN